VFKTFDTITRVCHLLFKLTLPSSEYILYVLRKEAGARIAAHVSLIRSAKLSRNSARMGLDLCQCVRPTPCAADRCDVAVCTVPTLQHSVILFAMLTTLLPPVCTLVKTNRNWTVSSQTI
jgi:hypothetical protein